MNLSTQYSIPKTVMLQVIDDEVLLFNSENGNFFALNDIGAGIWEVMLDYTTLEEVFNELTQYIDISPNKLKDDLFLFCESLSNQELIVCHDK